MKERPWFKKKERRGLVEESPLAEEKKVRMKKGNVITRDMVMGWGKPLWLIRKPQKCRGWGEDTTEIHRESCGGPRLDKEEKGEARNQEKSRKPKN